MNCLVYLMPFTPEPSITTQYRRLPILVFVATGAIFFLRSPDAFITPLLYCEDGRDMFAYYYNNPELSGLLKRHAGFVHLIPNILGYVTLHLTSLYAPYVFSMYALIVVCIAFSLFSGQAGRSVMQSDRARALTCIVASLFPIGNFALTSAADYSIWNLSLILFVLECVPLPRRLRSVLTRWCASFFILWSNPLGIVLLPVYVFHTVRQRSTRAKLYYGGLILVSIAYQWWGVNHAGALSAGAVDILVDWPAFVVERVIFEMFFGVQSRLSVHELGLQQIMWVFACALIVLDAYVWVRRRNQISSDANVCMAFCCYAIIAASLLVVASRSNHQLLTTEWAQRYAYVQKYLLLIFEACLFSALMEPRALSRAKKLILALLVSGYLGALNLSDSFLYKVSIHDGTVVRAFITRLNQMERSQDTQPRTLMLPGGEWSIIVNVRKPRQ